LPEICQKLRYTQPHAPGFAFGEQTYAKTVAWGSKDWQAVLEVVHGRYRHIMPATTGKPGP
jgi:hypothetical protein